MLKSRFRLPDIAEEALAGLLQRPARSILTMLGTTLGVGSFVAVLGLTATAGGQIDRRFTELAATEVTVADIGVTGSTDSAMSFPDDASGLVEQIGGVVHAGRWWPVPLTEPSVSGAPGITSRAGTPPIIAMDPSALAAARPTFTQGRGFDAFHAGRHEHVALLGSVAAANLGITRLDGNPAVFVDGTPFTVLGIIDDAARLPDLLFGIVLPAATAYDLYGPPTAQRAEMLVETRLGAAAVVAGQVALALRPDAPQRFQVTAAPDPKALRSRVSGDLDVLFLTLAGISLVIGAIGIANTTLVAVLERTNEIGLRRALGARPAHIAAQFLTESTTLGLLGGLVGTSAGITVVVIAAVAQDWTPLLPTWAVLPAPAVGAVVGLLAGVYPAQRAARVEPVEALRR
ncbi:ABC transporter permease [Actinoplanes rectilineatus]|uniref:ABC transporter permease n=1 Tax=Actinoplanes rectilineatus TaxID=113571 RepID=UPI0005F2B52D|nr:ABC transporter permease [Actinoplanes rectilineatus]